MTRKRFHASRIGRWLKFGGAIYRVSPSHPATDGRERRQRADH